MTSHTQAQIRYLDRLADYYLDAGDVDKAAGCLFESHLLQPAGTVFHASSVTARRWDRKSEKENAS